ncbi:MAG: hypothetical protein K6B40_02025 [Firmicutes bacterium]|nr:hypothetical protein [Bacillota bacterium]
MKTEETITWEDCRATTEELLSRLQPINDAFLAQMDSQRGVYILTYKGAELGGPLWDEPEEKVVYVGRSKYNSSRHFLPGSTGTSTIRRSLAALLGPSLDLHPIPRCDDPADNDRYNNYKLDEKGEIALSQWMTANFRGAFLELPQEAVLPMEMALIRYNAPVFNFQNNPGNTYGGQIKAYRKRYAQFALENEGKYI